MRKPENGKTSKHKKREGANKQTNKQTCKQTCKQTKQKSKKVKQPNERRNTQTKKQINYLLNDHAKGKHLPGWHILNKAAMTTHLLIR